MNVNGDDTGLIQGVVIWVGRYLGHKTRESGDRQGMKREESRLPSGALGGWPAGSGGREGMLAGRGRLWCRAG